MSNGYEENWVWVWVHPYPPQRQVYRFTNSTKTEVFKWAKEYCCSMIDIWNPCCCSLLSMNIRSSPQQILICFSAKMYWCFDLEYDAIIHFNDVKPPIPSQQQHQKLLVSRSICGLLTLHIQNSTLAIATTTTWIISHNRDAYQISWCFYRARQCE
jgi:hypothetical protein